MRLTTLLKASWKPSAPAALTLPIPLAALPVHNRKTADPSRLMHPADGKRYRCQWIEHGLSIHSDGNVTCGLDDPHGQRSFGNINRQSVEEIWANPEYERLQQKLWAGHRCTECGLAYPVEDEAAHPMPARSERPSTLVVETTVRCNLRCPQPACVPNNDAAVRTRDADFLDVDAFRRVADDLSGLAHVMFYNYGDPFVHAGAEDMLAHLRATSPDAHVITSTNGAPLSNLERARKLVASEGLDRIMFTISGVTQESYSRYHVRGRLDLAMRGMDNVLRAKRELGLSRPVVHWKYLVFNWNDSEAEIETALRLAEEHGVDEFSLYLTQIPEGATSYRFGPGSPSFARYRKHIENAFGYTRDCPQPDDDGFYPLEQAARGAARWTGWQARRRLRVEGRRARLTVYTSRPGPRAHTDHVFVITPWETVKVPLQPGVWRTVELTVPDPLEMDAMEVEIVTFDHWFPAEEYGSTDQRCLGVLVLEDDAVVDGAATWRGSAPLDAVEMARLAAYRYQAPQGLVDW